MIAYKVDSIIYPETGENKPLVILEEGKFSETEIVIEELKGDPDNSDEIIVSYSIWETPIDGLSDEDPELVEVMTDIFDEMVNVALKTAMVEMEAEASE